MRLEARFDVPFVLFVPFVVRFVVLLTARPAVLPAARLVVLFAALRPAVLFAARFAARLAVLFSMFSHLLVRLVFTARGGVCSHF